MTRLDVHGLGAAYDSPVLHNASLSIPSGQLVALVGGSGAGKTTLLRAVAGLHRPAAGTIRLGDRLLDGPGTHVPAHRRHVTLVPQEAALFPNLDVRGNVAFGLERDPDRDRRVDELLELVDLSGLGRRRPHELSGGQAHRVALARALAPRPELVLLDEPFAALDAGLRESLRRDVRAMLRAERATALLVTHDQAEALSMADEIAVMGQGTVLQQGHPTQVYDRPVDAWTARFIGESVLLHATPHGAQVRTVLGLVDVAGGSGRHAVIRPEHVIVSDTGLEARVERVTYRGHESLLELDVDGTRVLSRCGGQAPREGARIRIRPPTTTWLVESRE